MRAGLIPSKALQERKIIHERLSMADQKKKCKYILLFLVTSNLKCYQIYLFFLVKMSNYICV